MSTHRCRTALGVVIACALALPTPAEAQRKTRVGVVVGLSVNVDSDGAWQEAEALARAIDETFALDTVSGREAQRRLPDGRVPEECVASPECRTDIGRRLEADELVFLVIVRLGDELRVDPTWAHVASGDIVGRAQIVRQTSEDRDQVYAKAVRGVLPHQEPKSEKPTPPVPTIIVQPNSLVSSPVQDRPRNPGPGIPFYVAGGVSVASLVAGGIMAASAESRYEDLERRGCRDIVCDPAELDTLNRRAFAADLLLGVSAVSALTAGYFFFVRDGSDKGGGGDAPLSIELSRQGATLGLQGRF